MGQIRFTAPLRERLPPDAVGRITMTSLEGLPYASQCYWDDDQLVLQRSLSDSGACTVPWLSPNGREALVCTATLREQSQPYLLELELARGVLNRLRNQAANWDMQLNSAGEEIAGASREAIAHFVEAATTHYADPDHAAASAASSIDAALSAEHALVVQHSKRVLAAKRQVSSRQNTMLAGAISPANNPAKEVPSFLATFNAASIACVWHDIEENDSKFNFSKLQTLVTWCQANRLRVCLGPLLCFQGNKLPDWLYLYEDDYDAVRGYVSNFVIRTVQQFRGQAHLWEVSAETNLQGSLDLSEDQQLQLVVDSITTVRKHDPNTPLVVGFSQLWAEYLSQGKWELPPFHVADLLLRADLGVSGFSLDIHLGYQAPGSGCRELLELSQMIDRWSQLGAPLVVRLLVPSRTEEGVVPGFQATPQRQQEVLSEAVELLLGKPHVHGIVYYDWRDAPTSRTPAGGLLTTEGKPKPSLAGLTQLRSDHLL